MSKEKFLSPDKSTTVGEESAEKSKKEIYTELYKNLVEDKTPEKVEQRKVFLGLCH